MKNPNISRKKGFSVDAYANEGVCYKYLSLALEFRIFGSGGGGGGAAEVEGLGPGGLGPGVLGSTIDCTGLGK